MAVVAPWPAGHCPYVTPDQLTQWPVGVQWNTIPPKTGSNAPTPPQLYAVQAMICRQASVRADQITNTPLRSVETTEELEGPNYRVAVQWSSGNGRFLCSRWPVTQVSSMQVAPNSVFPRQWTVLPSGSYEPEFPIDGLYGASVPSAGAGGQSILFAPGYMGWGRGWPGGQLTGRYSFRVSATYLSGWPHACLTAAAAAGASSIEVDDCTGWVITGTSGATIGAAGIIYDALGGGQESIVCTAASATSGPGTLTLASELEYDHGALIAVSAMPETAIWATACLAGAAALARGATATTIQTTSGRQQTTTSHGLVAEAKELLNTFRRTV
jgi:hypothetical protein